MKQSKFQKIIAVLLVAMLLTTAMPTMVEAESLMEAAMEIDPMEFYSEDLGKKHDSKTIYFAINLPKAGSISLNCSSVSGQSSYDAHLLGKLIDSNGVIASGNEIIRNNCHRTIDNLQAGTYYLSIYVSESCYSFTNFYYTFTPDTTPTISLSITLKKGNELQLGTLIENSTDKAKWTSTKKSIATVSEKGLVKAVKAGTTYIKATLPTGEYASIKVTVKNK